LLRSAPGANLTVSVMQRTAGAAPRTDANGHAGAIAQSVVRRSVNVKPSGGRKQVVAAGGQAA